MPEDEGLPSLRVFLGIAATALAIAVGLLVYLRGRHPFFKVPLWRVLVHFSYGAIVAPVVVFASFWFLARYRLDENSLIGAFLFIGPVEEAAKFAGPLLIVGLVRRWREEPFEWMLAGAASGTGFAMAENILYAIFAPDAFQLLFQRSLAPMHLLWSGWLGYRIGRRTPGPAGLARSALVGFGIAAFLHGFWDALCFSGHVGLLFALFGGQILAFGWHVRKMAWLCANRSPRRPEPLAELAVATGRPSADFRCPACAAALESVALRGVDVLRCAPCGRGTLGRGDLFRLVNAYAGSAGWFKPDDWYGYYWRDGEGGDPIACPGCAAPARPRRFLHEEGERIGFCADCALATGDLKGLLSLPDRFRSRLENGFLHG